MSWAPTSNFTLMPTKTVCSSAVGRRKRTLLFCIPPKGKKLVSGCPAKSANPAIASVVYRKWLDILSPLFALFPLGPTWFYPFQSLACPLNFSHYLFDRRCPHERSGCFVPRLQELFNGLL